MKYMKSTGQPAHLSKMILAGLIRSDLRIDEDDLRGPAPTFLNWASLYIEALGIKSVKDLLPPKLLGSHSTRTGKNGSKV